MDEPLHVGERALRVATRQLAGLADEEHRPARRVTTVTSRVLHDLQIVAEVEGHRFVSDEAFDKGGHDAGPAPLRYFLAGVMMCHQVWVVKGAAVRGHTLTSVAGEIAGYLGGVPANEDGTRPFSRIEYVLDVEGDLDAATLWEIVDDAARNCPAVATVAAGTELRLTVRFNGEELLR